jgi:phage recombination protein Bet
MSEAASNEVVAVFHKPRLPWHPAIEQRFGVDRGQWKVLVEAVFPAAESADAVTMALSYCRARNLDIFKRPVQIVPIWDRKAGRMVETVWPGISELRTTAMRTGNFAGFDETEFGPIIDDTLGGVEMHYPEWARCTVYRLLGGQRIPFVGPKVYWLESYATAKKDTAAPNAMWKKRPRGQLEKCAEAAALRRAFPEEIGNEYAAEEMEGQTIGTTMRDVTPQVAGEVRKRLEARTDAQPGGFSTADVDGALAATETANDADAPAEQEFGEEIAEGDAGDAYDFEAFLTGEDEAAEKTRTAAEIHQQDVSVRETLRSMQAPEDIMRRWSTICTTAQARIAKETKARK